MRRGAPVREADQGKGFGGTERFPQLPSETRAALERARARLDRLALYPQPVRIDRVRVWTVPAFFKLPRLRRYNGYALWRTILLRKPPGRGASDDLITHELCHIWQMQNRPLHVLFKFFTTRYRKNPYEIEARRAVAETRSEPGSPLKSPTDLDRSFQTERGQSPRS